VTKRLTDDEFKTRVSDAFGDQYVVLEKYENQKQKILVRHNVCGREYRTTAGGLMLGHGCHECFKKTKLGKAKRLDENTIRDYVKGRGEFELIDIFYAKGKAWVKVKHIKCGNINEMDFQHFKKNIGCSHCAEIQRRKTRTKSHEQFESEVRALHGDEYKIIGRYTKALEPVEVKHIKCGYTYPVIADKLLQGRKCPECARISRAVKKSMTHDEFLVKLNEKWGEDYTPLDEYKRSQIKIRVRHNKCGHVYKVVPSAILAGFGCPKCCMFDSKACKRIEKFLIDKSFTYAREFKIKGCKHKYLLPFDFAILKENKIILLIEYDGEQHFVPLKHFGGNKDFEVRKKRDEIKNTFCRENNLKLLRISYKQDDEIEQILERELL
jgi:predicted  nucleic acid-binding Zn-ribbon protein